MAFHLIVISPFEDYKRGDTITDAAKVEKVLASEQEAFVRRVAAPAAPVAAPAKE